MVENEKRFLQNNLTTKKLIIIHRHEETNFCDTKLIETSPNSHEPKENPQPSKEFSKTPKNSIKSPLKDRLKHLPNQFPRNFNSISTFLGPPKFRANCSRIESEFSDISTASRTVQFHLNAGIGRFPVDVKFRSASSSLAATAPSNLLLRGTRKNWKFLLVQGLKRSTGEGDRGEGSPETGEGNGRV